MLRLLLLKAFSKSNLNFQVGPPQVVLMAGPLTEWKVEGYRFGEELKLKFTTEQYKVSVATFYYRGLNLRIGLNFESLHCAVSS
jgi:hypothetical protein